MADWTVIADAAVDPDAPLTSDIAYAWRDNPIAIAEGAANATRISLGAIERLVAGSQTRLRTDTATATATGTNTASTGFSFSLMQGGTARFYATFSGSPSPEAVLVRTRAGNTTILHSTNTSPMSFDTSVLPGDVFSISAFATGIGAGASVAITAQIRTNGSDLWPGPGMFGFIEGNSALT